MTTEAKSDPGWSWSGRAILHVLLALFFVVLALCSSSQDLFYLAAYIPPVLFLPLLALALLVVSLVFSFTCQSGKNLHLLCSLGMSVSLFLISLVVWKRDFEYGYTGSYDARILLGISGVFAFAVSLAWLTRRQRKTISMQQLAGSILFLSLVLGGAQQILRFDKMSSYELEIDAARELERAGIQLTWNDWSVSGVAIRNAGIRDGQLVRIGELPNLQLISLEGNPITDETLASISNVQNLHSLYLTDTNVGDHGLSYLENASNLQQLWLGGTEITDDGLSSLKNLRFLGYVDLSNTDVSDAGLQKLTHLKRMYYLHLPGTRVTKSGMESLGDVLPSCRIYGTPNGEPFTVER